MSGVAPSEPPATPLRLRTPADLRVREDAAEAEFELGAGESVPFVLEPAGGPENRGSPARSPDFVSEAFKGTVDFWRRWIGRSDYAGRWRDMVNRSALTLKLLTSADHGSVVAAPTFGLPEVVDGERNWDYRYTWIRDASFTLFALMRPGYTEEAGRFMEWLEERCMACDPDAETGPLQIMYELDGREDLGEEVLPHLEGYRGSSPVRIGNGACDQLQLYILRRADGRGRTVRSARRARPPRPVGEPDPGHVMQWVEDNWQRPDEGVWGVRGGSREFLSSRLMCGVALDRASRIAERRSLPAPMGRWCAVREEVYRDIYRQFWSPELRAFVLHRDGRALDASSLMTPLVGFVSPTDPRWLSRLDASGWEG